MCNVIQMLKPTLDKFLRLVFELFEGEEHSKVAVSNAEKGF